MSRAGGAGVDGEMAIASIASVQCSSAERSNTGENLGGPRVVRKGSSNPSALGLFGTCSGPK